MTTTYGHYVPIERNERPKRNGLKFLAEIGLIALVGYGLWEGGRYALGVFSGYGNAKKMEKEMLSFDEKYLNSSDTNLWELSSRGEFSGKVRESIASFWEEQRPMKEVVDSTTSKRVK